MNGNIPIADVHEGDTVYIRFEGDPQLGAPVVLSPSEMVVKRASAGSASWEFRQVSAIVSWDENDGALKVSSSTYATYSCAGLGKGLTLAAGDKVAVVEVWG